MVVSGFVNLPRRPASDAVIRVLQRGAGAEDLGAGPAGAGPAGRGQRGEVGAEARVCPASAQVEGRIKPGDLAHKLQF